MSALLRIKTIAGCSSVFFSMLPLSFFWQTRAAAQVSGEDLTHCRSVVLNNAKAHREPYYALNNLKKITVSVESQEPDLERVITTQEIKTAVELRCRSHGLKVVDNALDPNLYVRVTCVKGSDISISAVSVEVKLEEGVIFERDMSRYEPLAIVYEKGSTWLLGERFLDSVHIKNLVLRHVDEFLNDWFKANGR